MSINILIKIAFLRFHKCVIKWIFDFLFSFMKCSQNYVIYNFFYFLFFHLKADLDRQHLLGDRTRNGVYESVVADGIEGLEHQERYVVVIVSPTLHHPYTLLILSALLSAWTSIGFAMLSYRIVIHLAYKQRTHTAMDSN